MPAVHSKCPKCKVESEVIGSMCKRCNTFKVRLHRALKDAAETDPELENEFLEVTPEQKDVLYEQHHDLHGKDLLMKIWQSTEDVRATKITKQMKSNGVFKDKQDLDELYKSKPEQLKNIYKNAVEVLCPIKQCKMWADPEMSVSTIYEESAARERKLFFETNPKARKKAKAAGAPKKKPAQEGDANLPEEGGEIKLSVAEVEKLKKAHELLKKEVEGFSGDVATATGLKEFTPNTVLLGLAAFELEVQETLAMLEASFTTMTAASKAKDMMSKMNEQKKETKEKRKALRLRIKTAEQDRDSVGVV